MAIDKGRNITDIAADVSILLSDPNQRRWTSAQIVTFMNQAIRELARAKAFSRTDVLIPTEGQEFFATLAELIAIDTVEYNNAPLTAQNLDGMKRTRGTTWRTTENAPSRLYIPQRNGTRVWPKPDTAGTALVFVGSPDITEAQGAQITGDGYTSALNGTTVAHWLPGDGHVTNETAENNLRIRYHFVPRPSAAGDVIPSRYEEALSAYALWNAVSISDAPEEKASAGSFFQNWLLKKSEILALAHDDAAADDLIGGEMKAT